jgi:hypothetical protein
MAKLTREQHLAMARCLRAAKKKLKTGSMGEGIYPFVCYSVDDTDFSRETKNLVIDWIQEQIHGYGYVTCWATNKGIRFASNQEEQAYRHAWVDHMIKVLES